MKIDKDLLVGQVVAQDFRTAGVFKQNKIDFCCNGNRSLEDVCREKNIESSQLIQQLEQTMSQAKDAAIDYNSWPLDLLADYIEKKHHRYTEGKLVEIKPYLEKIISVHGERHPELHEVGRLFNESAGELSRHMKKEELILFPYIRKMVAAEKTKKAVEASFGTIKNPIQAMIQDHDGEGERFDKIAELTNDYTLPSDACNTYMVTLSMLKEFDEDLHIHIHLENNILFPKSIKLEESLEKP